jgi:PAS domain S-box-containing protein
MGDKPARAPLAPAFRRAILRYLFAVTTIAVAFGIKKAVEPVTGTGAPFVLFFAAVVATGLWAGPGPGLFATLLSIPLGVYVFVVRAGYSLLHALMQGGLFALDGMIVIYLLSLMRGAKQRAERSESRQRELIELAPDAFFLADLDGRFTDVNQGACRLLGYTREELIGKTIADVLPPEDLPRLAAVRESLLVPGGTEKSEWRHRRKDGTFVAVEVSANILPGGRWQAFIRDISDRKRIEDERQELLAREQGARARAEQANAELRASEERFRLTIEEAPIGMALVGLDGRFARVNAALCEIVGYPAEELMNLRFQDITHPDDLDIDLALADRLLRGEIPSYQLDKRYLRKDGTAVNILLSASIMRSPDGAALYYLAQVEDITERKRVEDEQRFLAVAGAVLSSSLDYEQTLTTLGDLIVRELADWCIIDTVENDDQARRLKVVSARPEQAPLCAQFEQLRLDRDLPHLALPVLQTWRPYLVERMTPEQLPSLTQSEEHLRIVRAIDPRSLIGVPMIIHGRLLGILTLISSSAVRRYRATDLRLAEALAERGALAIENGRLYQAALRATQLRDEVLGVVAHDLRNPVAAITMLASSLKRPGQKPERNAKVSESIQRAAHRANRLITDLLDVTLIEAGRLSVQRERLSARQLLMDTVDAQRPLASAGTLELRLELPDDLPDIWGDQHRLLQVLENLVGNAIKFTPVEGRITLGAAAKQGDVLFWVADTGCGIGGDGVSHVFDRFWQARKGARHGAGLGLPITRGIVEAHGGRIWLESTLGRGTIFFFTIPEAPRAGAHVSETMH